MMPRRGIFNHILIMVQNYDAEQVLSKSMNRKRKALSKQRYIYIYIYRFLTTIVYNIAIIIKLILNKLKPSSVSLYCPNQNFYQYVSIFSVTPSFHCVVLDLDKYNTQVLIRTNMSYILFVCLCVCVRLSMWFYIVCLLFTFLLR